MLSDCLNSSKYTTSNEEIFESINNHLINKDVLLKIITELSFGDLGKISLVSTKFFKLIDEDLSLKNGKKIFQLLFVNSGLYSWDDMKTHKQVKRVNKISVAWDGKVYTRPKPAPFSTKRIHEKEEYFNLVFQDQLKSFDLKENKKKESSQLKRRLVWVQTDKFLKEKQNLGNCGDLVVNWAILESLDELGKGVGFTDRLKKEIEVLNQKISIRES